ncbi:nitroreductase family protein [Roseateles sp. DC23W]|uniref:Nitroreductase family protein n=1 Tax=Pelomonas dachongensis TaxID=3299029 RepID=A0ABW7EWM4_9BURK
MGIKQSLKQQVQKSTLVWGSYQTVKAQVNRLRTAAFYRYDAGRSWRYMIWRPTNDARWALSSELLFQYHKLEKGLVMPGKPRLFGTDPVRATMALMRRWEAAGHPTSDPIYRGACATVSCYRAGLQARGLERESPALAQIDKFLSERQSTLAVDPMTTPVPLAAPGTAAAGSWQAFEALSVARRSVRDFSSQTVPAELVQEAVRVAALSPSACNRQPNKVVLIEGREEIDRALAFQNGNRGFGHKVPLLAVLVVDSTGYFDGSERNQAYVDGGLFAMSLMFALRALGLGSCSLNWCVTPATDRAFRKLGHVKDQETIMMMLAIGYPPEAVTVPLSPRRHADDVIRWSKGGRA